MVRLTRLGLDGTRLGHGQPFRAYSTNVFNEDDKKYGRPNTVHTSERSLVAVQPSQVTPTQSWEHSEPAGTLDRE
jgi:hypothetical protein